MKQFRNLQQRVTDQQIFAFVTEDQLEEFILLPINMQRARIQAEAERITAERKQAALQTER